MNMIVINIKFLIMIDDHASYNKETFWKKFLNQ